MKVEETQLKDCFLISPQVFDDERGHFYEGFNQQKLEAATGITFVPKQLNQSASTYGVLRGLHFQTKPKAQAKLITCIEGEILDVAVDLRKNSPTYAKYFAARLSEGNKQSLYIPKGMAHGFLVLSDTARIMYLIDELYSPLHDSGISYQDPQIDIDWGFDKSKIILSAKDRQLPTLKDLNPDF